MSDTSWASVPVPLILLAAGRSTRFGTLKQVAPVGPSGASILTYTVVDALLAGFSECVLVVRPEIEQTMREHLEHHLGGDLPIRYVPQENALGTAHAALLALAGIDGSAAVCNGDDAYGRPALSTLFQWGNTLAGAQLDADQPVPCALVAYPIIGTLSEHGGVSRGWVQADGDAVMSIEELLEVRLVASDLTSGGRCLEGRSESGNAQTLPIEALGSMNLWLLGPGTRPLLEQAFEQNQLHPTGDEIAIPTVLGRLREDGDVVIRLAGEADGWFGLTFAADQPAAQERLADAHRAETYTLPLARMVDRFRRSTHSATTDTCS